MTGLKRLHFFAAVSALLASFAGLSQTGSAQTGGPSSADAQPEASYSATADPSAIIVLGHARFTVLTPQLIRMEWAADGHFEDRPSMLFLNRRLTVPKFKVIQKGKSLTLETDALILHYTSRERESLLPRISISP